MKQQLAIGKVVNGRMTVITKDGTGYSRPTRKPVPTVEPVQQDYYEPISVDLPRFMKQWMDDKNEVYQPPREGRIPVRRSILSYIKEHYWI
jgi:hypothetical protein